MKIGGILDWYVDRSLGAGVNWDIGGELVSGDGSVCWDVFSCVGNEFGRGVGGVVVSGYGEEFEL